MTGKENPLFYKKSSHFENYYSQYQEAEILNINVVPYKINFNGLILNSAWVYLDIPTINAKSNTMTDQLKRSLTN